MNAIHSRRAYIKHLAHSPSVHTALIAARMANNASAIAVDETNSFENLPLFHDVFFTIVPSPDITDDAYLEVRTFMRL
jgi:hypothetical protein